MKWSLSISYPLWYVFLCLVIAGVYAGLMYYKSRNAERFIDKKWAKYLLPLLRFIGVALLSFFLLSPVLQYFGFLKEKPIVAVLVDSSKTISEGSSEEDRLKLKEDLELLRSELGAKYKVEYFSFSNTTSNQELKDVIYSGAQTDISKALNYINTQYVNQNLGASVLISDGIYNSGNDPIFEANQSKRPIYTIGIGDTSMYSDFLVSSVSHNSIAYLGNDYPVRVELKATKLNGKAGEIQLLQNGQLVETKSINISSPDFYYETDFKITASKVGQTKLEVRITTFDNEMNTSNNRQVVYVDVIDGKKKVEIWSKAPHPDIGMLKSLVSASEKYETNIRISNHKVNSNSDLVILHNWFGNQSELNLFEELKSNRIPVLVIFGNAFQPQIFNKGSQSAKFNSSGRGTIDALPQGNSSFEYFDLDEELRSGFKQWSPLKAPFGKFSGIRKDDIVVFQTIGSVQTQEPLIAVTNDEGYRYGVIAGTGIWQWRILDFEKNSSHQSTTELVSKLVQYLAVKQEKKLLKVFPSSSQYSLGDKVTLLGELYNQSLESMSNEEIEIEIINEKNEVFKHVMMASESQYRLNLNNYSEGTYRYNAKANVGGTVLRDNGSFSILGQQRELVNLTANFQLLEQISDITGGAFYTKNSIPKLIESLDQNDELKTVISEENRLKELINITWIFWILIVLFSLEWFVRKWIGGY